MLVGWDGREQQRSPSPSWPRQSTISSVALSPIHSPLDGGSPPPSMPEGAFCTMLQGAWQSAGQGAQVLNPLCHSQTLSDSIPGGWQPHKRKLVQ